MKTEATERTSQTQHCTDHPITMATAILQGQGIANINARGGTKMAENKGRQTPNRKKKVTNKSVQRKCVRNSKRGRNHIDDTKEKSPPF